MVLVSFLRAFKWVKATSFDFSLGLRTWMEGMCSFIIQYLRTLTMESFSSSLSDGYVYSSLRAESRSSSSSADCCIKIIQLIICPCYNYKDFFLMINKHSCSSMVCLFYGKGHYLLFSCRVIYKFCIKHRSPIAIKIKADKLTSSSE